MMTFSRRPYKVLDDGCADALTSGETGVQTAQSSLFIICRVLSLSARVQDA